MPEPTPILFTDLGLPKPLLDALAEVGYESPSPIQAATIPPLLAGCDVIGQAQTGTGKTAAFALPILARLEIAIARPQALVLAPTRELAIQVAEAFQRYAQRMPDFHVLPIYGGQGYGGQLHGLKRGAHVIVGTPGRIKDHLTRGTLDLSGLRVVVLDEADEMLRMGFIEDVEEILGKTPPDRQVALFSATMPAPIKRIAQNYLKSPAEIAIRAATTTVATIKQRYWLVSGVHKLDALTRILEAEPFEAMIVFARTKLGTEELAERLQARGFAAAAINGDLVQAQREKTIAQLKDGKLDILVATDVAARGLDVERISHVLNYDIPYDSEAYVHRIGRTGRAGRSGEAILFVTPRERQLLRNIERATRQPIEQMLLPSVQAVNERRVARFQQRIGEALQLPELDLFRRLIAEYAHQQEVSELDIAAALARLLQGKTPLLLPPSGASGGDEAPMSSTERPARARPERAHREQGSGRAARPAPAGDERPARKPRAADTGEPIAPRAPKRQQAKTRSDEAPVALETYRVDVGHRHGLKPGNLVGAIANEAGLESRFIGRIEIADDHSLIDLPEGMPKEVFQHLKKVWVAGRPLQIRRADETGGAPPRRPRKK